MLVGEFSENLKIGIIIQARMLSTRLPGKVLKRIIANDTMLDCVINRVKYSRVNNIIVATSTKTEDDVIAKYCQDHQITCYRGSEENVLERYYLAAKKYNLDIIIRITSDCPLIDPFLINDMTQKFIEDHNHDYMSNIIERTYPRGLDVEIFTFQALEKTYQEANLPQHFEHVTAYIYTHPNHFKLAKYIQPNNINSSQYRLTVDTPDDLDLIRKIYLSIKGKNNFVDYLFETNQVIKILKNNPQWISINQEVPQKFLSSQAYLESQKSIK